MAYAGQSKRIKVRANSADVPPEHKELAKKLVELRHGEIGPGPYGVLVYSPELACRVAHLGEYARFESTLPKSVTELVILATTRELDADYPWTVHQNGALKAGVSQAAIDVLKNRAAPTSLAADERLIIEYVHTLLRKHRISDEMFDALKGKFGVQGVVDLAATVGIYTILGCALNTFGVEVAEV